MAILGGGPSLTPADAAYAQSRARVIAINDSWCLAPMASVLYAADAPWWDHYEGVPGYTGMRITQDKQRGVECAARWGLWYVRSEAGDRLSFEPSHIGQGWNGGFQALNLAVLFGARRVVLLGYDMQRTGGRSHWHGDHPGRLNRSSPYEVFRAALGRAAEQLAGRGVEVINCSRETALECFPRRPLDEVL